MVNKGIMKTIRISDKEKRKWNSKLIHSALNGDYKFLYDILIKIKLNQYISEEEIERVKEIEEMFENA